MDPAPERASEPVAPPSPGILRWWQPVCWLPAAAVLGVLAAWAAAAVQQSFAPLVLFPLLVGTVAGLLLVALVRLSNIGHRPTILAGAILAVLVTIAGQHYAAYWKAKQAVGTSPQQMIAAQLFPERRPPETFLEYLQREADNGRQIAGYRARGTFVWLTWALEAILVAAPALVLVAVSVRLPYCNRCQTWYRAVRGRRVDRDTAAPLAAMLDISLGQAKSVRYRLMACHGGCGPTGLALFWDDPSGSYSSGYVWLGSDQRSRVLEILDRFKAADDPPLADPGQRNLDS